MEIRQIAERDMDESLKRQVAALQRVAFPNETHFKTKRWVHTLPLPEDPWFHAWEGNDLVGNVWLHHRTVQTIDGPRNVGGIANVCSSPAHRGTGAAKGCMRAAAAYMENSDHIDFGLLFCGETVRHFYASLGWQVAGNRCLARQPDGTVKPVHDGCVAMYYDASAGRLPWPGGDIDLNGPDW